MAEPIRNLDARLLRYRQNPASEDAAKLAHDLLEYDRPTDVLEVSKVALRRAPDQAMLLLFEGRAHLRLGDLVQAQASLLKAARLLPEQKDPFRWLGDVLLKRGDPERATKVLEHAFEVDPGDSDIRHLLERARRLAKVAQPPSAQDHASEPPKERVSAPPNFDEEALTTVANAKKLAEDIAQAADSIRRQSKEQSAPLVPPRVTRARPSAGVFGRTASDEIAYQTSAQKDEPLTDKTSRATLSRQPPPSRSTPPEDLKDAESALGMFQSESAAMDWVVDDPDFQPLRTSKITWMVVWIICIGSVGGGFWAWQRYIEQRHQKAQEYIDNSLRLARMGSHEALVTAERQLRIARDLNAKNGAALDLLLLVQSERALEEGTFDPGYLRPTVARAKRKATKGSAYHVASAIIAAADGDLKLVSEHIREATTLHANEKHPELVDYLIGRLEQRLGDASSAQRLTNIATRPDVPAAALISLAEMRLDEGKRDAALQLLNDVEKAYPGHLRAKLWQAYITADTAPIEERSAWVKTTERSMSRAAPTDRVLLLLIKSTLERRQDKHEQAERTISAAMGAGASDPRLLALLATQARTLSALAIAQQCASQAVAAAPSNADYRKLYAEISLERRDGLRALATLESLSTNDPEVLRLSAEAAIQVGSPEALTVALRALDEAILKTKDAPLLRALRVRAKVLLGQGKEGLREAKELRDKYGKEPSVWFAYGEAALSQNELAEAERAFKKALTSPANRVEATFGLARVMRARGQAEEAIKTLKHLIELSPDFVDARLVLADIYVDYGDFDTALPIYEEVAKSSRMVRAAPAAELGRAGAIDSLIELGRLENAQQRLSSLPSAEKEDNRAKRLSAKLALALGDLETTMATLSTISKSDLALSMIKGDVAKEVGKFEEAKGHYDTVIAQNPNHLAALVARLLTDAESGELKVADKRLPDVEHALQNSLVSQSIKAQLTLAKAVIELTRSKKVSASTLGILNDLIDSANPPKDAWYFFGIASMESQPNKAAKSLSKYLELAPKSFFSTRARKLLGGLKR